MSILSIDTSVSVNSVEELYKHLYKLSASDRCDLRLAQKLSERQFGGQAALIQFLITWSQVKGEGRLLTYVEQKSQETKFLTEFLKQDHILAAVLLANDVQSKTGKFSVKENAYKIAKARIELMEQGVDFCRRGPKVLLLCVDHSSKGFLPQFYHPSSQPEKPVRDPYEFILLAKELAHLTADKMLPATAERPLGSIIYELFKNTHDWARTRLNGERMRPSLRGLLFELHASARDKSFQSMRNVPNVTRYLAHDSFQRPDERFRFLEISIFDSGPGYAQRWLNRTLSEVNPQDEYQAVLKCLAKHSTTSLERHRGLGLFKVMRLLTDVKGFLRIRTGRLSLYRDFVLHPFDGNVQGDPQLFDWATGSSQLTRNDRAAGSLLTMLIPLVF